MRVTAPACILFFWRQYLSWLLSTTAKVFDVGAKHIRQRARIGVDLRSGARAFREALTHSAERRCDQLAGQSARRVRCLRQRLAHEGLDRALAGGPRLLRLGRIAIERSGVVERDADCSLVTFRPDERADQGAEPFGRRTLDVREDA